MMFARRVLVIASAATCFSGAQEQECEQHQQGGAPWFGAAVPQETFQLQRRGFEACALCGGAERLGVVVDGIDAREVDAVGAARVIDAVRAHGVVVLKGQNLTRGEQPLYKASHFYQ